jgi:hypothetical protein
VRWGTRIAVFWIFCIRFQHWHQKLCSREITRSDSGEQSVWTNSTNHWKYGNSPKCFQWALRSSRGVGQKLVSFRAFTNLRVAQNVSPRFIELFWLFLPHSSATTLCHLAMRHGGTFEMEGFKPGSSATIFCANSFLCNYSVYWIVGLKTA